MPNKTSYADFVNDWQRLTTSVEVNQSILPDLIELRERLLRVLAELQEIMARQDGHRAGLRAETKRLRALLQEGRDLALRVRAVIRAHLGPREEKLAEFRIPVLGRTRPVQPATEPTEPTEPPQPGNKK